MKQLTGIVLFLIAFTTMDLQAQMVDSTKVSPIDKQPRGTNMISCTAYENITYNGHTISEIDNTEGSISGVHQLWGTSNSNQRNQDFPSRRFVYAENVISIDVNDGYTEVIRILDSSWPVTILGKEVRVGDHFDELMQKFGSDIKIIFKPELGPEYNVSFNCLDNDVDGLLIYLNPVTHIIYEITYFEVP